MSLTAKFRLTVCMESRLLGKVPHGCLSLSVSEPPLKIPALAKLLAQVPAKLRPNTAAVDSTYR